MTPAPYPSRRAAGVAGAGAWALALLSLATAALQIAAGLPSGPAGVAVGAALVSLAAGCAQGVVTAGVQNTSTSASWVLRFAAVAGWTAAAMLLAAGVATLAGGGSGQLVELRLAEFAPVAQGFWALAVCAAAWRSRTWPTWLRVTGAVWGAGAAILPGAPVLNGPVLLVGLAWWTGLGVALLRGGRSTSA